MPAVDERGWMLRAAALMGAGTFAVHQARYALGWGHEASGALAAQGHGYLITLGPLLVGALLPVLAGAIRRAARGSGSAAPRFGRLWAGTSLALVAAYVAQESIEGALAAGHPDGIAGVFGHGGWLAVPLAVCVGLAIALLMRGAGAAGQLVGSRRPWRALPVAPPRLLALAAAGAPARARTPGVHGARGPPPLSA